MSTKKIDKNIATLFVKATKNTSKRAGTKLISVKTK